MSLQRLQGLWTTQHPELSLRPQRTQFIGPAGLDLSCHPLGCSLHRARCTASQQIPGPASLQLRDPTCRECESQSLGGPASQIPPSAAPGCATLPSRLRPPLTALRRAHSGGGPQLRSVAEVGRVTSVHFDCQRRRLKRAGLQRTG